MWIIPAPIALLPLTPLLLISQASEREYTMWLKAYMEAYRLDNAVSGYEWWLYRHADPMPTLC